MTPMPLTSVRPFAVTYPIRELSPAFLDEASNALSAADAEMVTAPGVEAH
jgi:hypothetical protein